MEEQIIQLGRDFAEREIRSHGEELEIKPEKFLPGILKKASDIGIFSYLINEEYGELLQRIRALSLFSEEISRAQAGVALIFLSHFMALLPFALSQNKQKNLKIIEILTVDKDQLPSLFSLCLKEKSHLFTPRLIPETMKTRIKKSDNSYFLSGEKISVNSAALAEYLTVAASDEVENKITWLVIPTKTEGVAIKPPQKTMGLKICPICDISFNKIKISEDNIISEHSFKDLIKYYSYLDSFLSAVAIGMAREAYERALDYTKNRYQGGKMICNHEAVRTILSEMITSIKAAQAMSEQIFYMHHPEDKFFSSILPSAFAAEICVKVSIDAVQLLGGYGYMKDYQLERIMRDAQTFHLMVVDSYSRKMEFINHEIKKTTT